MAKNDANLPEAYRNQGGVVTRYCLDGSAALLINEEVFKKLGLNPDNFKGNVSDIATVIRVALTTKSQTPDLYELLRLIGKDRIKARFEKFM